MSMFRIICRERKSFVSKEKGKKKKNHDYWNIFQHFVLRSFKVIFLNEATYFWKSDDKTLIIYSNDLQTTSDINIYFKSS